MLHMRNIHDSGLDFFCWSAVVSLLCLPQTALASSQHHIYSSDCLQLAAVVVFHPSLQKFLHKFFRNTGLLNLIILSVVKLNGTDSFSYLLYEPKTLNYYLHLIHI